MTGEQKHKRRKLWIDQSRLLGYTITPAVSHVSGYWLVLPDGTILRKTKGPYGGVTRLMPPVEIFVYMWQAAFAALVHAGLDPNATIAHENKRAGSGKADRLRERR